MRYSISTLSPKVYPNFKNVYSQNLADSKPRFFFDKRFENIKAEDDFRKAQLDQNERAILLLAIISFMLTAGTVTYMLKGRSKNVQPQKQRMNLIDIYFKKFESLKDNPKVPTLETCKSINKELREILEMQVKQAQAQNNVVQQAGEILSTNRLMLFGPAGVGKSYFAKIYAKSLDADYMEVLYSDFNSPWAGEGVENLKFIFEKILDTASKKPTKKYVVTFNEIDAIIHSPENLIRNRGGYSLAKLDERSVFLNYMEVLREKVPNVTVIGTTNISPKNNGLDKAAMSRFKNIIEVSYPDKDCLFEAIKMNLSDVKNMDAFITENEQSLKELVETMVKRRFSFRNLENTVNKAKEYHRIDKLEGKDNGFKMEYLNRGEKSLKLSDGELE